MIYNLKSYGGTFKGHIGECMFKLTQQNLVLTKFFSKQKYFELYANNLSEKQKEFLSTYWYTIDSIMSCQNRTILFEIKTKNKYINPPKYWMTKMTAASEKVYLEAMDLGFEVKVATVWLYDNWEYEIEITDFKTTDYAIDQPKRYDGPIKTESAL